MQVWNVLHAARWKYRTQKRCKKSPSGHCQAISSQLRRILTIGKNLLSSNISPTCSYNMVNFGPLVAEIVSLVWSTWTNFNVCRVLAALLHSQTAALNRGRHLYSAGRPSHWALAHISSSLFIGCDVDVQGDGRHWCITACGRLCSCLYSWVWSRGLSFI